MSSASDAKGKTRAPRRSALAQGSSFAAGENDSATDPYSLSFDPNRLKVAELRALLFQHDVHPPSTARKPALIQAYEDHIRGNASELRATRNRDLNVRPDGREILYLANGQVQRSPSVSERDERRTSAPDDEGTSLAVERARSRRSVSWAESVPEVEVGNGAREPDVSADISSFSMENPFQSHSGSPNGIRSSHIGKPRASEPAKRDSSMSDTSAAGGGGKKRALATARRSLPQSIKRMSGKVTDEADESGEADSSQGSILSPLVQKQRRTRNWVDQAGETSEKGEEAEAQEVGTIAGFLTFTLILAVMAWWAWYARESQSIGFCDNGRSSNSLLDQRFVEQAAARVEMQNVEGVQALLARIRLPDALKPSCAPCPVHGRCRKGELLGCESDDYVLRKLLPSYIPVVRSLLPLSSISPLCEPDEEKLLLAADLADEIESRLRHWKADVYCHRERALLGPRDEPDWGAEGVYALPVSDIYHDLNTAASRGSIVRSQAEGFFRQLWDLAMTDLEASGRVQQRSSRLLAMRGPLGVGLRCRVGLTTSNVWRRLRVWVVVGVLSIALIQWLRYRLRDTSQLHKRARELVEVALEKLQAAKRRQLLSLASAGAGALVSGSQSPQTPSGSAGEGYYSITQLRDSVLQRETNEAVRKALWAKVGKMVEANTNVRTRQAKVQGEWAKVWEWVGPVDVDDAQEEMKYAERRSSHASSRPSIDAQEPQRLTARPSPLHGRGWNVDETAPEKVLEPTDYNAGHDRRPSAEV